LKFGDERTAVRNTAGWISQQNLQSENGFSWSWLVSHWKLSSAVDEHVTICDNIRVLRLKYKKSFTAEPQRRQTHQQDQSWHWPECMADTTLNRSDDHRSCDTGMLMQPQAKEQTQKFYKANTRQYDAS